MDYRRANRIFLYMILSAVFLVFALSYYIGITGRQISVLTSNVLSEAAALLPALAVVLYSGDRLSVLIPIHKIKISSAFLSLLYVILLFPLVSLFNALSMFFVENEVSAISDLVLAMPFWTMFLSIGVFGPFVEEIIFRGILLQSYQRSGRILGSIILSAVLFGSVHMNFNQFAYATVMGIMFALLVEATGSVLSSFLAHAFFNSIEVVALYGTSKLEREAEERLATLSLDYSNMILVFELLLLALVFTTLAGLVVLKISEIEGRKEFFTGILKTGKGSYKLITVPLIVAMVIAIIYMVLTSFLI